MRIRCSNENFLNDMAMHIGQSAGESVMCERQLCMIQSKEMQNGGIEIVNRQDVLYRFEAQVIRDSVTDTAFDASTG